MVVEMLFSGIKDMSKLYQEEQVSGSEDPFGGETTITSWKSLGKEYCEQIMLTVNGSIVEIKEHSYQGSFGRIANEIFVLLSTEMMYTISCTIDTYEHKTARMIVKIESVERTKCVDEEKAVENITVETAMAVSDEPKEKSQYNPEIESDAEAQENIFEKFDALTADLNVPVTYPKQMIKYDAVLEKVKIGLKNAFRPDWESCVWVRDEQSEQLCSELYPSIFNTENKIRAFVNKALIWNIGSKWLESPGLEKYAESCKKRAKDFRGNVPAFSDVDDALISATLEMLFEIVKEGKIYEPEFKLQRQEYDQLIELAKKGKGDIAAYIQKRRTVKVDLWKDIFENYFGIVADGSNGVVTETGTLSIQDPQQLITDFIKNRNHVAHNKPLTYQAYKRMEKSISDMNHLVTKANRMFEESIPSEEMNQTWSAYQDEIETEEQRKYWKKNYLRIRIEGETGVEILWHNDIFELFCEVAANLYTTFHDRYYFDEQYGVSEENALEDSTEWQTVFNVSCMACEDYYIEVQVSLNIEDDMDEDSYMHFRYILHKAGEVVYSDADVTCTPAVCYHNGSGGEDFDNGGIELFSESETDMSGRDEFLDELDTAIKNLNPYIPQIESLKYESVKEGTTPPVAEFPCWECDKYGVSLREDFYKFGHCCYCGSDNEVENCSRCGSYFNGDGGKDHFCNNCISEIEEE